MPRRRTGRIDKHGNSWRCQVYVDGKRIRRSFATREEAQRALNQILASLDDERESAFARKLGLLSVADVVHEYYERRKPHLEASTQARYDNVLKKYVMPRIGSLDARELAASPVLLQDFLDAVPWGSARKALEVLGPALRMAYDNGLIPSDPVTKIRRPKRPGRRRKKEIPTPAEVEKMVIAAYEEDVWWGYFVELTATLGTRRAETCALRWEDFDFPARGERHGRIHIRRAVGKRDGGIYIKAPKSGQERDVLAGKSLFLGLDAFDGASGWLFPGRDVRPRRDPAQLTPSSTGGRLLVWLLDQGGDASCPSGRTGARARRAIGTNSATFSQASRWLADRGFLRRETNARRTFRLALTECGREEAESLAERTDADLPIHPDTAGHRFEAMLSGLGLRSPSGKPYTLHSLRHYRATHLYNRSKDWVQVARYLGHTSPAITMELYANNVVQPTQELLADAAAELSPS